MHPLIKMKNLALFLLLALYQTLSFGQQAKESRTIQASGMSLREITPNQIFVQIELREYEKKNIGKIDLSNIQQQFLKACKGLGIADSLISIVSYQGYDGSNPWLQKKKKKDPSLMAGIQYQVQLNKTSQIDQLVQLLDDEATQQFFIAKTSHSDIEKIKLEVQKEALIDAKKNASWMCEAIGEKLGHAITIYKPVEVGEGYIRPMASNMMLKADMAVSESTQNAQADYKKIKIQYEVNIVFALQ